MAETNIVLTKREIQALVHALEYCRDQTQNHSWRWWTETNYADDLYKSLKALVDSMEYRLMKKN